MSESRNRAETIRRIADELRTSIGERSAETDEQMKEWIESYIFRSERTSHLNYREKILLVNGVFNAMRKDLGFLQPYLEDDSISEIMVNGKDDIFVEESCFASTKPFLLTRRWKRSS